jgi:ADP-heptose:LPS heptosyltransferase
LALKNDPHHILVFHAGALGDLVNTLPALQALRAAFPRATLTAIGNLDTLELFQAAGVMDQALSLEGHGLHALFIESDLTGPVTDLIAGHDLAVSWIRNPILVRHLQDLGLHTIAFTDPFPPPPGSGHVSAYLARPLAGLGITSIPPHPRLSLSPEIISGRPRFPGIVLHPGSGSPKKNWPAERWAFVAHELCRSTSLPLALLEGPADEKPVHEILSLIGPSIAKHFSRLPLLDLASLLVSARLVLANDSGVAHLAGALGAPVVAVFGPTDPAAWAVNQPNAKNLAAALPCAPCIPETMRACEKPECRESVSVEETIQAALSVLYSRT